MTKLVNFNRDSDHVIVYKALASIRSVMTLLLDLEKAFAMVFERF